MIYNEILIDGEWVKGEPTVNDQRYRTVTEFNDSQRGYAESYWSSPNPDRIEIVVNPANVNPVLPDFDDTDTSFTVYKNTDITVTGDLAIPDQNFRVPFKRCDNGEIYLMQATVKDGKYSMVLNFSVNTKFVVNTELVNSELPEPIFTIDEQTFYVVNKQASV